MICHARAVLLLLACLVVVSGEDLSDQYWACSRSDKSSGDKDYWQKQRKEAASLSRRADGRLYGRLLQSLVQVAGGDREAALKTLGTCESMKGLTPADMLALADAKRHAHDFTGALAICGGLGETHEDMIRVLAAEGLSDVFADMRRYQKSQEWIEFAIATIGHIDRYNEQRAVRERLQSKKRAIERMQLILKHGYGFLLYTEARGLEMAKSYDQALARYEKLIDLGERNAQHDPQVLLKAFQTDYDADEAILEQMPIPPVYVEAASCYRTRCLIEQGDYHGARKQLQAMLEQDRHGLYRGEVLLLLGRIALEGYANPKQAADFHTEVIQWVVEVRALEQALEHFAVPSQSTSIAAPPKAMRFRDASGNLLWSEPGSRMVVNRLNCGWYEDYLLLQAHTQRAVCRFLLNQPHEATADLERMLELDQFDQLLEGAGRISNFARLRDDFKTGRMYATAEELALFQPKQRIELMHAEMLFETERWDQAIDAYRSFRIRHQDDLSKDALGYLCFVEGSALLYAGRSKEGRDILLAGYGGERAMFKDVVSWPRALMALANAHIREDPIPWFERGYLGCRKADDKADFLLRMGQFHFLQNTQDDDKQSKLRLAALLKLVDDSDYRHIAAQKYIVEINHRRGW